jgi:divalent metal cation (Fe/Co/Zn/Cd) transporter
VTPAFVIAVAIAIILAVMSFLAMKYPRGKGDWGRDRAETVSILATSLTFVMLFLLLWYASATVDWPEAATIAFWAAACLVVTIIVMSLVYPEGLKLGSILKGDKDKPE